MNFLRSLDVTLCAAVLFVSSWNANAQSLPESPLGARSPVTGLLLKDDTTVTLIQNSSGDRAHHYVSHLYLWSRDQATQAYEDAAAWVEGQLRRFGLSEVQVDHFPADGITQFLTGEPAPRFWKVERGELWMTSPYQIKLTSYADLPISLCKYSASADVEADLVDIGRGTADDDYRHSVRGKIVLTSGDPTRIVERAVYQEGALGIISYWNIPEWDRLNRLPGDSPTLVGWPEFPDLSARPHGTFAFMITPQRAHELEEMMGAGAQIRLRALVDARTVPGTFSVVSATIPGSRNPHQEIVLTAHLDEIGANDNASGSAVLLEVARTLKDLIDRKQIPPPVRTVRFLWGPEFLGPRAWLSKYLQGQVKRIANLNYDMSGEDLSKTGSVFSIVRTPDSTPSFLNALMECILDFMNRYNDYTYAVQKDFQIISVTGSREALRGRMEPFEEGSDHELFDHLGIPAVRIHAAWPDWFYHSSKDSPDKSDPTTLHRSIFAGLAAIVSMSYAEDPQAVDLGQIAWEYGKRGVARDVTRAIALVSSAASANLPARARWARAIARHAYDREQAAILSCGVFAENPATERILAEKAADLGRDQQTSMQSIDNALSARATELGVALPSVAATAAELEAARLVPMRRPGEELKGLGYVGSHVESKAEAGRVEEALTAVEATMKREGAFDLQVYAVPDAPAFYVDGHRSILDIWEHFAAEYRPLPLDILRTYFDLFEKAGVMTMQRK